MKLLIAADIFPPDVGGPATYSHKLGTKLVNRGWKVDLVCYSDSWKEDGYAFNVHRVVRSKKLLHHYMYFKQLYRLAKNTDLIYAMGPVSAGLPAMIVAKLLRKKIAVKVVGDYAWEQARNTQKTDLDIDDFQKQKLSGKVLLLKKIETWVCSSANQVIVPSEYLKKIVSGWGVNPKKISVIYNSISFDEPRANVEDQDPHIIISIGRLVPWKGFKVLIELLPDFLKIDERFRLIILGYGPDKKMLLDLARELGVQDHVEIKKVDHRIRDDYLKLSGIFVLNTGYEGLSHTLLEVLAVGVPIVTTDVGGNPEVIQDGKNGLLVEYNNKQQLTEAILKLYKDKELRKEFVENGRTVLPKFTFSKMIDDTAKLLKSL